MKKRLRIETFEGKEERTILTGLIVNEDLLREVSARFEPELFPDRWSNLLCQWCVQFYNRYKKAPEKSIDNVFRRWAEKSGDKVSVELIDKFLTNLGSQYKSKKREIHGDEIIDLTLNYFNKVKLGKIKDELETYLDNGDVAQAEELVAKYRSQTPDIEECYNPYLDQKLHRKVFRQKITPQIKLKGAWGDFFGDMLARENLIAIQAREKGGKSYLLQELAHQAAMSRLNVIFFGIGDMSLTQTVRRFQARICRRPLKGKTEYWKPTGWKQKDEQGLILPRRIKLKTVKAITIKEIEKARGRFQRMYLKSDRDMYKLICQPAMSVAMIESQIEKFIDKEKWKPDIIAIDYADLLDPPAGVRDRLDQIDINWRNMRNMALDFNCLVLTATQSKRTAYNKFWQTLDDVSDNKKKAAHVNAMLSINLVQTEFDRQVRRFAWVVNRETTPLARVVVAGCLGAANPVVSSTPYRSKE